MDTFPVEYQSLIGFGAIGLLVLFLIFYVVKKRKKRRMKAGRIFLNRASGLSEEEYKKIALGALYSEQQMAFINSVDTGLDSSAVKNITEEWWQVKNAEDALGTLEYLSHQGFEFYFPAVVAALHMPEEERYKFLRDSFENKEDADKAYSQLQHLEESYEELKKENVITTPSDVIRYGVSGWDAGRLVFMARVFYNAGYISLQQAWNYINHAQSLARANFSSWREYASSYIIGRAMWGGRDAGNNRITAIARYLLQEPNSPWVQLQW